MILTSFHLTDANMRMINTKILIFDKNLLNISNIAMRYLLSLEKNCSNELFGGEKSSNIY